MRQTIEISDHLATQIEQYLQKHPEVTLSDLIETALEQKLTLSAEDESPELIDWMRREVAIGAEQADRQEFSKKTLNEIKAQVLLEHQQHGQVRDNAAL
ncbi:hypothetical protein ACKFKG_18670 [Phormidesmis sp. 146-35]